MNGIAFLLAALVPAAAGAATVVEGFTEDFKRVNDPLFTAAPPSATDDLFMGSVHQNYRKYSERINIPGFISASPIPEIASIVGPKEVATNFRVGDVVFLRWTGTSPPAVGERYETYTPTSVLQSLANPTDFSIVFRREEEKKFEGYRRAGYLYEISGSLRITKVSPGLVEAVVEGLRNLVAIGDHLMPPLPVKESVQPFTGGVQLSAAVVSGSPVDTLSTQKRAFIYINRGSRDGIREGRVFQAIESVQLEGMGAGPEFSLGEAMVVHVSDSYSTAIITRQFDVIRIGSLLKTKQEIDPITSKEPFQYLEGRKGKRGAVPAPAPATPVEEIPDVGAFSSGEDPSLPDPTRKTQPAEPALSELDALERAQKFQNLTNDEKKKLGTLSRQEKIGVEETEDAPAAPTENSFGKPAPKKAEKKKRVMRPSDEEELNHLMMQN